MATLILSTVGNQLGGPIGGAIGAIIGQRIDAQIFAPKGRKGPRLNELAVQTSSYGSPLPKLFGTNRVAGTVIWATDLKETTRKVSNGKGQPKSTVYSYSASFAVALSARRIARVDRIWADGNLLRGAAGDFKTETGFRLYLGDETQDPDPLIASAEGIGLCPAYRGLAYAVFEDFQLGEYGNRIPSLSFEVVADDGDVALGTVVETLSGDALTADWSDLLAGVAVTGDSVRAFVETFAPLFPVYARQDAGGLRLIAIPDLRRTLVGRDLGATGSDERSTRVERERRANAALPGRISVAHYEPARDYQQGLQRIDNVGGTGRELRIDLPATAGADQVKACAASAARRLWSERTTARVRLPWRALDLATGQSVALPDDDRIWRVSALAFERMSVLADLVAHAPVASGSFPSDSGGGAPQPDTVHGPTVVHLLDLPPIDDTVAVSPRIAVAAAGPSSGWRRASLLVSTDHGASWQEAGPTAVPAIMGSTLTALPPASPHLRDAANSVEVELLNADMQLGNAGLDALANGANAAMIGKELIQFETATPIAARRYRLSGLLRGRRGTEWAIPGHAAGDAFTLLSAETLASLDVPAGVAEVRVMAVGVGDAVPPVQSLTVVGEAVLPPTVVARSVTRLAGGDTQISWVRRSRNGWRWLDGADAPLVEESERYAVQLMPDAGSPRTIEVAESRFVYTAAERAADIAAGSTSLTISVRQLGTVGTSRPASISFSIS